MGTPSPNRAVPTGRTLPQVPSRMGVRRGRLPDCGRASTDLPSHTGSRPDIQRQRDLEAAIQGGRYLRPRGPIALAQHRHLDHLRLRGRLRPLRGALRGRSVLVADIRRHRADRDPMGGQHRIRRHRGRGLDRLRHPDASVRSYLPVLPDMLVQSRVHEYGQNQRRQ